MRLGAWRSGPGSQRDGQSVVHESGHGVQERGSGCCENGDSQAWLWELAQTVQGVRIDETSLHEYTNLLEYDFGTTDGSKKKLLTWENQIVDFQKATGEVYRNVRLCCRGLQDQSGRICEFRIEEITELFEWH